jgi:hypothetical protein
MNVSRPEAEDEYSSAAVARTGRPGRRRNVVLALGLLGAVVLVAAELSPLLHVRTVASHPLPVRVVRTGPHDGWALLPVAVAIALVSLWVWRTGSRLGLALVGLLGAAALAIALARDLPDAHATGLVGSPGHGLHTAQAHAAAGLYLETLGAAIVLVTAAGGLLLAPPAGRARRARPSGEGAG